MVRITASGLSRVEKCPASASLPRFEAAHADAEAGTVEHAVAEANPAPGERREVAYALDVETGRARYLGQGIGRRYDVDWSREIPGTLDSERVEADRVVVTDDKTGFGFMVARAAVNLQLAHNAVCAADVHGRDAARVIINRTAINHQDVAELDALDLAAARARIRSIWRAANAAEPPAVTGDHCWRCPCISRCPAQTPLALTIATGKPPAELPTLELTREAVAVGWPKLQAFKKLLGEVERVYRAYAAGEPVPLGGGRWLGPVSGKREKVDGRIAALVLNEMHGAAVAAAGCEIESSKAAIDRALKTIAPRGKKAAMVRAVLDAIAAAGGIQTDFTSGVEEYAE